MNSGTYKLKKITLSGFKSFGSEQTIELGDVNVLIGVNGSGKSNFTSFLKLLEAIGKGRLQEYVAKQGFANNIIHKSSNHIKATIEFTNDDMNAINYGFVLTPSSSGCLLFAQETLDDHVLRVLTKEKTRDFHIEDGYIESKLYALMHDAKVRQMVRLLTGIKAYHFHDTPKTSLIELIPSLDDNKQLNSDGSNLLSFLYHMKTQGNKDAYYQRIIRTIKYVVPQLNDFDLNTIEDSSQKQHLNWIDKHNKHILDMSHISAGSLRYMVLTALLLQPKDTLPKVVAIDEPELSLHPDALMNLVGMIKIASQNSQIILSTQSSFLMNLFEPEEIIVVSAEKGYTELNRLDAEQLRHWYGDYTLAELWEKNLIGGRK